MASMCSALLRHHPGRDLGILDAEGAAEAAADLALLHLEQRQPVDAGQQLARLALDLELAQARSSCRGRWPSPASRAATSRTPMTSTRKLTSSWQRPASSAARSLHRRIVVEQLRQMQAQHPGAGAGRRHDIVVARKLPRSGRGRWPRWRARSPELNAGWPQQVCRARHLDPAAGLLQQLDRRESHRGPEQVDQAGDEQGDARAFRHEGAGSTKEAWPGTVTPPHAGAATAAPGARPMAAVSGSGATSALELAHQLPGWKGLARSARSW